MLVPNILFLPIVLLIVSIVLCLGTGVSDAVTIPGASFPSQLTWPNPRSSISDAMPMPSYSVERSIGTNISDVMRMPLDSIERSIGTNNLEFSDAMPMLSDSVEMNIRTNDLEFEMSIGTSDLEFSDAMCMPSNSVEMSIRTNDLELLDVEMSIGTNNLEFSDAMCMPLDSVGINSHVDLEFSDVILTSLSIRTNDRSEMHLGGLFESCFDL
ncbi:hypothetical protein BYT27DRAFT_7215574 [Phlegmacium glaucopus]|nr:hypothetical protein BYT27DRAFT_7215574 [Phlegmacium glaucopus]